MSGESTFGLAVHAPHALDKSRAEQRHDRHRHQIGGDERYHYRQGQRGEEELADSVQQRYGKEDDHGGERRRKYRQRHLLSALLRRYVRRLTYSK